MKHRAFTIWEALVVIAILAIGAAILMPPGAGRSRENARRRACASNLRHIGLAFRVYAADNDDKFLPRGARYDAWPWLLANYIHEDQVFTCPSTAHQGSTDYFYNLRLATAKRSKIKNMEFTVLSGDGNDVAWPTGYLTGLPDAWRKDKSSPVWRHLGGANYLFIDGHVKWLEPKQFFGARDAATPTFEVK